MTYPLRVVAPGFNTGLNIRRVPSVIDDLNGGVEIIIDTTGMTITPTIFSAFYVMMSDNLSTTVGSELSVVSSVPILSISGLTGGKYYRFRITAGTDEDEGNTVEIIKYISKTENVASATSFVQANGTASKSLLSLTNSKADYDAKRWAVAYKNFDSVTAASSGDVDAYYAFGTAMYMDSNFDNPNQSGAIGFFLSNAGQGGYYLLLDTTSLAASANKKELRIVKANSDGSVTQILDSQRTIAESLNGVYGGREYLVNIKVHFSRKNNKKTVRIYASVNGYRLYATDVDTSTEDVKNVALVPTNTIGLVCRSGKTSFDYAYATSMSKPEFEKAEILGSVQNGIFSNDLLQIAYGDIIYDSKNADDQSILKSNAIDEFGTTVREIYNTKLKFDTRPSFPLTVSTGLNTSATILGAKMGNFDAEIFMLNNSSTMLPIDGSNLYIYGNTLSDSGQLQYITDETSEFVYKDPIIFETKWLQSLEAVESLAKWIKQNVVNKGKLVNMEIFGNPILSIGDIVTIKYPYADLSGNPAKELFIITNLNHEYEGGGLSTNVTCRKIYFSAL